MSTDTEAVYRFLEAQVRIRVVPEPTLPAADLIAQWQAQWQQWSVALDRRDSVSSDHAAAAKAGEGQLSAPAATGAVAVAVSGGSAAGTAGQLRSRPVSAGDVTGDGGGDGGGGGGGGNSSNSAGAGGGRCSSLPALPVMQPLSSSPPIWLIRNFLSVDECAALVAAGTAQLGLTPPQGFPDADNRHTAAYTCPTKQQRLELAQRQAIAGVDAGRQGGRPSKRCRADNDNRATRPTRAANPDAIAIAHRSSDADADATDAPANGARETTAGANEHADPAEEDGLGLLVVRPWHGVVCDPASGLAVPPSCLCPCYAQWRSCRSAVC